MLERREFLKSALAGGVPLSAAARRPNIIFIFVDDLGYGDLGVTGNRDVPTPNIDRLARDGIRFTQFYVASPICSPSRVAVTTGQFPARHLIHSYLSDRKSNRALGMRDFLDPEAPCVARTFQQAGYATGHFGKWHMGGGRDVGEAPLPQSYGFAESYTSFEGLGDRVLITEDSLSRQNAELGRGRIDWAPKHKLTEIYVDRAIDFIRRNKGKPFYIHLWPSDVHDEHIPRPDLMAKYEKFAANPYVQRFYAVLDEFDRQMGRLLAALDEQGLADQTLVAITGDNGPTAWPRYYKEGYEPPGSTAGFRGRKWSLYEGGIRQPLIARWKGVIPAGKVDETTIMGAVDLLPTFCSLAGVKIPSASLDGEDMSPALKGKPRARSKPLLWEYGRDARYLKPGREDDQSPNLAIRDGRWKLLMNADNSRVELYDFNASMKERENVASKHPEVSKRLSTQLTAWWRSLPPRMPQVVGDWWQVAGDPDLGSLTTKDQQPVDFAVWQAADGTWQLQSCIRKTAETGKTRLFYRWEGSEITDRDWKPVGIAMRADPALGETPGGLQAPHVIRIKGEYHMFYGDWENICLARSKDGKNFTRVVRPNGKTGMFTEGAGNNTRDIMVLEVGELYHGYYTAYPNKEGADYLRTSRNLVDWGPSKRVAFGGQAGTNPYSAECPFVYFHRASGFYFLFRTQRYGEKAQTSVYRSKDPTDFGVNDDRYFVGTMPVAAPEIVEHEGKLYMAALLPSLKGIQIARLAFTP